MRKVLITGITSPIGLKIAEFLAGNSWRVYGTINKAEANTPFETKRIDFSDLESIKNYDIPKIDLLINNAAVFHKDKLYKDHNFIKINFIAPLMLARKCAITNPNVKVINIFDAWATNEQPKNFMQYALSKKLLETVTRCHKYYGISIGATVLKNNQNAEIFNKIAEKYLTSIDDILAAIEYIIDGRLETGEILDLAKCKK